MKTARINRRIQFINNVLNKGGVHSKVPDKIFFIDDGCAHICFKSFILYESIKINPFNCTGDWTIRIGDSREEQVSCLLIEIINCYVQDILYYRIYPDIILPV